MILDIIALAIICFLIYKGRKKGLVKTLFSSLSFVIALILTITTLDAVYDYVKTTEFGNSVYESIRAEAEKDNSLEQVPEFVFIFSDTENIAEGVSHIRNYITDAIGNAVIKSLCGVMLFVAYSIIIKLASGILDTFAKLPVLNAVNMFGGIVAGAINAWIFMVLFTCFMTFLLPTGAGEFLSSQLEKSILVKWFCNNNPLL